MDCKEELEASLPTTEPADLHSQAEELLIA